jgi:hypothetical protein
VLCLTPKDQAQDKPDSERRNTALSGFAHVLPASSDSPDAILRIIPRLLGPAARYPPTIAPAADFNPRPLDGREVCCFPIQTQFVLFYSLRGHCYIQVISTPS